MKNRTTCHTGRVLGMALAVGLLAAVLLAAAAQAADTTVEAWGRNTFGELGTGTATATPCHCEGVPRLAKEIPGNVTELAAGREHTLALLADGSVIAWGGNFRAQLGDGTTENRLVPVRVKGLSNVVAVAASEEKSLALLADGTVEAWGENTNGQLGRAQSEGPETCPEEVVGILIQVPCSRAPIRVPGVSGAVAISAGEEVASALRADGTVVSWGTSTAGGLGNGSADGPPGCECLGPVAATGLSGVRTVVAGGNFGLAALADGGARSWGLNKLGELGTGTSTPVGTEPCACIPTPTPIMGLPGLRALAAGEHHALALLGDGGVEAWGGNEDGELGVGPADEVAHPTPAQLLLAGASGIVAGAEDSFALVGPSHDLEVSFAGAGTGKVGGAGVLCPPSCGATYPQGQVAILRAEAQGLQGFAGFSGACTGTGPCQARMDRNQAVVATFGRPKGTRITRARISARRHSASFLFSAPGAITGYQCMLLRPRAKGRSKVRKARFTPCRGRRTYKRLAPGRYTFRVRAVDRLGPDAHPAVRRFRIGPL